MRYRQRYVPVEEAQAGMLLGAPADAVKTGAMIFSLPSGHLLTEENLHQMTAHQVEYIFVLEKDDRSDAEIATDAAAAAHQVMQVFEGADLSDPNMLAFFDQILAFRSA